MPSIFAAPQRHLTLQMANDRRNPAEKSGNIQMIITSGRRTRNIEEKEASPGGGEEEGEGEESGWVVGC